MTQQEEQEDGPYDDVTHWIGDLPKASVDSTKHPDKRDTRRETKPDVQRKELPKTEGQ